MADDFSTWWDAYPRKQAKADARKAWRQTSRVRPPLERLQKALAVACGSDQWKRGFIPLGATYLRGERWDDVYDMVVPAAKPKVCAYCDLPASGSVSGRQHCGAHQQQALYNERPKEIAD